MEKTIASIITIGDELLIGQVIDTNSAWMAQELNKAGIWVHRRVAVGDDATAIRKALDQEKKEASIILITGGLGPTADDITKPLLCEYFGGRLVIDEQALTNVRNILERVLQRPMIERNLKQAEVPDVCTVIQNKRGTAPGMWFEKEGRIFVSMPGVPHEMKGMMSDAVLPALRKRFDLPFIAHRTILTAGIGESYLAEHIAAFESALPPGIRLAYLPNYGMVRLRLTARGGDPTGMTQELEGRFAELKRLVEEWMVADEDLTLEEAIGRLLTERGRTMSTAESCTGGNIAHLITSVPGSSRYFKGSVVSYDNAVKENLLKVDPGVIASSGAVSEEVVRQMVAGVMPLIDTDLALAVSGIMGPDGGTPEKPVGTVWVAAGDRRKIIAQKFQFRFDRQRNIELTSTFALNLLRKFILSDH